MQLKRHQQKAAHDMPVYDFSKHEDRLAFALDLPSRERRSDFLKGVKVLYGNEARQQIISAMQAIVEAGKDE